MKETMSHISIMAIIIILFSVVNTFFLAAQIKDIKKEIVEIKKDYSYDPRDAK